MWAHKQYNGILCVSVFSHTKFELQSSLVSLVKTPLTGNPKIFKEASQTIPYDVTTNPIINLLISNSILYAKYGSASGTKFVEVTNLHLDLRPNP